MLVSKQRFFHQIFIYIQRVLIQFISFFNIISLMWKDAFALIFHFNISKQPWNFFPQLQTVEHKILRQEQNTILENNSFVTPQQHVLKVKKSQLNLSREDLKEETYQRNKTIWSQQQDQLLRYYVQIEKRPMDQIPNLIPNRNFSMCYNRYRRLTSKAKQNWKKAEDQKIIKLVQELGNQNWKLIAIHLQGRTAKKIRQHYENNLKPNIKKDEWEIDEDLKIIQLINEHGFKWKLLQKYMNGRTQNQIKNRYYGRLKKIIRMKQKKGMYRN